MPQPLIPRAAVPEWLRQHYGEPAVCTKATLAKMHWQGTGPVAVRVGRRIGHTEEALHDWVRQRSLTVTSTSDAGRAGFDEP